MFEKFVKTTNKAQKTTLNLERTAMFLSAVKAAGCRLSYAALARAARALGEDSSGQIPAQRGAALVKQMEPGLQPWVCRREGGYAKGVRWDTEVPGNLRDLPVLDMDTVEGAVEEWLDSIA